MIFLDKPDGTYTTAPELNFTAYFSAGPVPADVDTFLAPRFSFRGASTVCKSNFGARGETRFAVLEHGWRTRRRTPTVTNGDCRPSEQGTSLGSERH